MSENLKEKLNTLKAWATKALSALKALQPWQQITLVCSLVIIITSGLLINYYYTLTKNNSTNEVLQEIVAVEAPVEEVVEIEEEEETGEEIPELEAKYLYYEELYDIEIPRLNLDFAELQETVNEDIYAWLYVPGTDVSYPILQHPTDDSYYLNYNLDGTQGYPGCLYTELINSKDFTDSLTIIYGHNMRAGTMFGTLKNFRDADTFDENKFFYVYLDDDILVYAIIRAYRYSDVHLMYAFDTFTEAGFLEYIDEIRTYTDSISFVNEEVLETLDADSKILTLSTCMSNQSDKRYLVQGVLLDYPVE